MPRRSKLKHLGKSTGDLFEMVRLGGVTLPKVESGCDLQVGSRLDSLQKLHRLQHLGLVGG